MSSYDKSSNLTTLPRLALLSLFASALLASFALARRDAPPAAERIPQAEVVVFEVEGCVYCELFRRDVWPAFRISPRHAEMPLRFVDVRRIDLADWPLTAPVTVVPTVVVMRDGREIGRMTGYTGPEAFFQQMRHLMAAGGG